MSPEKFIRIIAIITISEVVFCFISAIAIALIGGWIERARKNFEATRQAIIDHIVQATSEGKMFTQEDFSSKFSEPRVLLSALDELDLKLSDPTYLTYKKGITDVFLFPIARKWYSNIGWQKRNFAARTFSRVPLIQDEKRINKLLSDKIPLNRLLAARAAIFLGSEWLLRSFFERMADEPKRALYAYRDLILDSDKKVFDWIQGEVKRETDPNLRYLYLDVLCERSGYDIVQYIDKDLQHSTSKLRHKAVNVLLKFPGETTIQKILEFLKDENALIRADVCKALPSMIGDEAVSHLEEMIKDKEWWVRLQAALSLRKVGEKGERFLKSLIQAGSEEEKQVAEYVFTLPISEVG